MFVESVRGITGPRASKGSERRVPPDLVTRVRPVSSAASRTLPLPASLAPLFPGGVLRRGSTTVVIGPAGHGVSALAVTVLAGISGSGGWCAVVGMRDPGVVAMAELGVELSRLALVPSPGHGAEWAETVAWLTNAMDAVLLHPPGRARSTVARHLVARARERQAALVVLASSPQDWPEVPDVTLTIEGAEWHGIGKGHGYLRSRRLKVRTSVRRSGGRAVRHLVWLPS